MIASCPRNPNHQKFTTRVTVRETWVIDPGGNYLDHDSSGDDVIEEPNARNPWWCLECGEQAKVEDE